MVADTEDTDLTTEEDGVTVPILPVADTPVRISVTLASTVATEPVAATAEIVTLFARATVPIAPVADTQLVFCWCVLNSSYLACS